MATSTADSMMTYAGLGRRIVAFVLDFLIIGGYILILFAVGVSVKAVTGKISFLESPITMNILAFFSLVLPVVLYFTLQERSSQQATWGKRCVKIKVVNAQGGRMYLWQSGLRSAIKFIPWQLAHTCVIYIWFGNQSPIFLIGALAAQGLVISYMICQWISKRHQAPYDWLAGAFVVTVPTENEKGLLPNF